ncbi:MAG: ComF family protein [Dehalococcoidia bacterium]|nr:ComF family protein [Dehalococcoidia bacterium]
MPPSPVWTTLVRELAELLLPQRCVACGAFGDALHTACIGRLAAADGARCSRCWAPVDTGRSACARCEVAPPSALVARRAAFRFEGIARRAILEAKFRGIRALFEPLSLAAAEAVPLEWGVECVVPVPLHASRERERGFNQGALIASHVGRALGVPVRGDLVRRARRTRVQASLGRMERARNVEGAFVPLEGGAGGGAAVPASALLVDDVTTTGATLEAVSSALRAAGVRRVVALALAIED